MEITMGQYRVTTAKTTLTATGIGSCVAITLYDRRNHRGGMAHATLPHRRQTAEKTNDATYVDSAIEAMLSELEGLKSYKSDIECKIVGGSNMFPNMEPAMEDIGKKNVEYAKKKFKELQLPLVGESVGGVLGRSVEFCPTTGIVTVMIKF
jgi:chemotaxis protein CheD